MQLYINFATKIKSRTKFDIRFLFIAISTISYPAILQLNLKRGYNRKRQYELQ
ncbi:hypothetical protein RhiirA5_448062 [Rhizophagus irregularis]|uniref:Uncharacterized protein n=1 Tax=Rhizophagus irregularis TaxID=588596 RepID=A0A2N0NAR7_9GLOM|nr:hypothetical protein RhiirA5_448062 [Rhizophagus irregularis]